MRNIRKKGIINKEPKEEKRKRNMIHMNDTVKEILEWTYCIIIAIVLALIIRYFVGTPTIVQQKSMYPTLKQSERLILNRLARTFHEMPERGDIITFEAPNKSAVTGVTAIYDKEPENWFQKFTYYVLEINKMSYIKRVIALPGEHVQLSEGKVFINGEELQEEYLQPEVRTEVKNTNLIDFVVPEGYVFAMGDNRDYSSDCREFGCIPLEKIESKVWIRFWPLNLFGKID